MNRKAFRADRRPPSGFEFPKVANAAIQWPPTWHPDEGWPEDDGQLSPGGRAWRELDAALGAQGSSIAARIAHLKGDK